MNLPLLLCALLVLAIVPTELHVFHGGGHGFGMRAIPHPIAGWPKLCEEWLRARKLIPNPSR